MYIGTQYSIIYYYDTRHYIIIAAAVYTFFYWSGVVFVTAIYNRSTCIRRTNKVVLLVAYVNIGSEIPKNHRARCTIGFRRVTL